tara:strand:- start:2635 stop:4059 length:1425 start_codon:yes stop_codon:yes gene_type:complete
MTSTELTNTNVNAIKFFNNVIESVYSEKSLKYVKNTLITILKNPEKNLDIFAKILSTESTLKVPKFKKKNKDDPLYGDVNYVPDTEIDFSPLSFACYFECYEISYMLIYTIIEVDKYCVEKNLGRIIGYLHLPTIIRQNKKTIELTPLNMFLVKLMYSDILNQKELDGSNIKLEKVKDEFIEPYLAKNANKQYKDKFSEKQLELHFFYYTLHSLWENTPKNKKCEQFPAFQRIIDVTYGENQYFTIKKYADEAKKKNKDIPDGNVVPEQNINLIPLYNSTKCGTSKRSGIEECKDEKKLEYRKKIVKDISDVIKELKELNDEYENTPRIYVLTRRRILKQIKSRNEILRVLKKKKKKVEKPYNTLPCMKYTTSNSLHEYYILKSSIYKLGVRIGENKEFMDPDLYIPNRYNTPGLSDTWGLKTLRDIIDKELSRKYDTDKQYFVLVETFIAKMSINEKKLYYDQLKMSNLKLKF